MSLFVFKTKNNKNNKYILKNRIKDCRVERNLTQKELGELLEITKHTIAVIEKGAKVPSLTIAVKLACIFDKEIDDIFYYVKQEER